MCTLHGWKRGILPFHGRLGASRPIHKQLCAHTHTRKRGCTVGVLMISEEETAVVFNGGVELIRPCVKRGFEDIT